TSTNLLVDSLMVKAGLPGFGLFEFSALGLVMMGAGMLYLVVAGPFLLPDRSTNDFEELSEVGKYLTELRVQAKSALIGKTIASLDPALLQDLHFTALIRAGGSVREVTTSPIEPGDVLLVQGEWPRLLEIGKRLDLRVETEGGGGKEPRQGGALLVEAMVAPNAHLQGHTLAELDFRTVRHVSVLAMHRRGEVIRDKLRDVRLAVGDLLLMAVPGEAMAALRRDPSLVIVSEKERPKVSWRRALVALAIMVAVVAVTTWGWMPIVATAIVGCIALVLFRGLTPDEAYEAIDWRVVMLLAGLLPLGLAIQKSGLATIVVGHLLPLVGGHGPLLVMATLYLVTMVLTEFMSNTAAAVLLAPIAITSALDMHVNPKSFVIAVMFAASTSFATPVGYQTNTMVYNAGGYRFSDFMKIGIPLNLLFWLLAMVFIPRMFPFQP
ncbi:MAG: SLC13 family permease, partial [Arenimonas sp.]